MKPSTMTLQSSQSVDISSKMLGVEAGGWGTDYSGTMVAGISTRSEVEESFTDDHSKIFIVF